MKKSNIFTQTGILIAILVVANLLSSQVFLRLDFTEDKRYTLSDATKDIINNLEDVITVTAYYSEDLPPQLLKSRQDFMNLLVEYENRSDGNIVYEFVNPNKNEEAEMEAQQAGISPIMVNVRERDQVKQMRAYMGVIMQQGEEKEVIPVIQPGTGMEYALTTAIKKLSVEDKPRIAFLQGHGEPSPNASMQLLEQLSVLYDVEPYTITDTAGIPSYYRTVAIIAPNDTFPRSHLDKLDQYLAQGGNIYLAYNTLQANLNQAYLQESIDIGLKTWLSEKGITINDFYVIDANCGSVTVRQQQGFFMINSQVQFPYFPIITNFSDHPAVQGLESVFFPFVTSLTFSSEDSAVHITPLAFTSENTGIVQPPSYIDIDKDWEDSDFTADQQIVGAALEGPIAGPVSSRMIMIPNGDFAVNGEGQQQQQVNEDNVNLASNSIDWLSDDTGLISLRTKGVTNRPLEQIEDTEKSIFKYGNVLIPILLVLVIGFYRRQRYQSKKQKWIQGNI